MNVQTLTPTRPVRTINFAKIHPLFEPATDTNLVSLRGKSSEVRLAHRHSKPQLALDSRPARLAATQNLQEIQTERFSVPRGKGSASRVFGTLDLEVTGAAEM